MKIMFVINSLVKGGAERVVSNLANYLNNIDNNEIYITLLENKKIEYKINQNINILYCREEKKINNKISKLMDYYNLTKSLKNIFISNKPDVIISFLPKSNFVSLFANKLSIPIIVSTRNDHRIEFPNRIYEFFVKKIYKKASGIICQTQEQKEFLNSLKVNTNYIIIPNPINEEFITKPYDGKREKVLVNVARLKKQKNQKLLIESFAEISEKINDYKLIIYGDGDQKESLDELIKSLNMQDKITLYGKVDNIKDYVYKSSLFILTSNYEGMPNALIEAMALGLPVISTDCPCGGPKFLINNNENGILISVNNKEELQKSILKVLSDEEFANKISKNANKICETLKPSKIYGNYYEFIKKIGGY